MWPTERYADVAKRIVDETGWTMVVCGSKAEAKQAASVIKSANIDSLCLTGKTTLPEFVEVVRGARLLVGNETSAVHIAACVQTDSVCILGGGHFGRFVPYSDGAIGMKPVAVFEKMDCFGCNWKCVSEHDPSECAPCISAVSVDQVIAEVLQLIV